MFNPDKIKFNEVVCHDQSYFHTGLQTQVEKDFYNRVGEKSRAEALLISSESRKPVILIGERRMGKTSLLMLLVDHLNNDSSREYVAIKLSWTGIHSLVSLCEEILQAIYFEFDLDIELPDSRQFQNRPAEFINTIRNFLSVVPNKRIVICLDEFDSLILGLSNLKEKTSIINLWNEFVETSDLPVKLLLTTAYEPHKLLSAYSAPLLTKSEQIRLHPFSKTDLDEMILGILGTDVPLTAQEREYIYELSGGWPYFAKLLLVCMVDLPSTSDRMNQMLERAILYQPSTVVIEHIYEIHLDDDEKAVMLLLAKFNGLLTKEDMAGLDVKLKRVANQLVHRGYVMLHSDGSYRFRIGFLRKWFPKWIRFEVETESRIKDILLYLKQYRDPWAKREPVSVTPKETPRSELRRILIEFFNETELRDLCFDLKVNYDGLPGQGTTDKARELVAYIERRGRISELENKCRELRPYIFDNKR